MLAGPLAVFGGKIQTPLELNEYSRLTSHAEMMEYLQELEAESDILTISIIGQSVQGRDIPALYFSLDKEFGSRRDEKLVVLIYCQQHGNEPSSKEAALVVARDLINEEQHLLENLDLILVPMANPDGADMKQRRNANNMDLNRNHVILSEPESLALHSLFLKWMPEVTLDVHEFNASSKNWFAAGYMKDAEEMFDYVSNLNIAPEIIDLSSGSLLTEVGDKLKDKGFRFHRYTVGGPPNVSRIRHSTTNINDGRQSMGIYNTFSFIFEGKRFNDLVSNIERRTAGQTAAMQVFLDTMGEHFREIMNITHAARRDLLENPVPGEPPIQLHMDYFADPERPTLNYPVFDLMAWKHVVRTVGNYEPQVRTTQTITRPVAYIFSKDEERLIDLLSRHQIEMGRLADDTDIEVEIYRILKVTPIEEEDKPGEMVKVRTKTKTLTLEWDSVVVYLQQRAGNLIPLLLEPQSSFGICTERSGREYRFDYLRSGRQYPIFRLMNSVALDLQ